MKLCLISGWRAEAFSEQLLLLDKGLFCCHKHGRYDGKDAAKNFLKTQFKRLGRAFTLSAAFKYFAHDEKNCDVYQFDPLRDIN